MQKDIVGKVIETYKEFLKKNNLEDNLEMKRKVESNTEEALDCVEKKLSKREYRIFLQEIKRRLNVQDCLSEFCLYKAVEQELEAKYPEFNKQCGCEIK